MINPALAYKQTQVGTTGQGELVVMLYDGALRYLEQARAKIQARDYAAKGILITKAMDVINELDTSLNMEVGGDLCQNLHNLYFLCNTKLLQANLKLDVQILDSVVDILSGLRSAFAQILNAPEAQAACASIGAKHAQKSQSASLAKGMVNPPIYPSAKPTALDFVPAPELPGLPGLPGLQPNQPKPGAVAMRKLAAYANTPK